MTQTYKLNDKKIILSKGRTRNITFLEEKFSGPKAKIRKKILDEFSISDQLKTIRKAVLSGDNTQLKLQDQRIDDLVKGIKGNKND